MTIDLPAGSTTLTEQEAVYEFTVTIDKPHAFDVPIYINVVDGTATEGEDFTIPEHQLFITAGNTTTTGTIEIHLDGIPEEQETFTIQIGDDRTANTNFTPETVEFTINNYVPVILPSIHVTATWDDVDFPNTTYTGCDLADIDIYVTDPAFTVDYSSADGATGACPESFDLDLSTAGNGTYHVYATLYDAVDVGDLGPIDLPVHLTFERAFDTGDVKTPVELGQVTGVMSTEDIDDLVLLAVIEYADGVYTILDPADVEVGELKKLGSSAHNTLKQFRERAGR